MIHVTPAPGKFGVREPQLENIALAAMQHNAQLCVCVCAPLTVENPTPENVDDHSLWH